jgi:Leucine-rich repeat (LRR) protein
VTGPIDNMAIALTRIAEEAERRTGTLDLSNLRLQSLPEALFELRHLRELDLGNHKPWEPGTKPNQIDAQRKRLECLALLEVLSVRWSDLSSLDLVRSLQNLEQFDCSGTPVTDLTPLAGLSALKRLDCCVTQVIDLTPLAGLSALQRLNCRSTKVTDLTPLARLSALQQLDCSETRVTDLTPLAGLSALQELDCSKCRLQNLPPSIFTKPSLKRLVLYASHVPGVPPTGILSQKYYEDCLDRVRAHFADLAMGSEVIVDIRMRSLAVERSTPVIETPEKTLNGFSSGEARNAGMVRVLCMGRR